MLPHFLVQSTTSFLSIKYKDQPFNFNNIKYFLNTLNTLMCITEHFNPLTY